MTQMRSAMEKAGILLPADRLRKILEAVPEPRTLEAAQQAIIEAGDVEAALALFDPQIVASRLRAKLKECGASQGPPASQGRHDRPTPSAQASHSRDVSHGTADRLGSDGDGSSRDPHASHASFDRPVAVSPHSRSLPHRKQTAAPTKISRKAVLAYASSSIFARQIGSGIKQVGEVTRFDVLQIKRRGMIDSTIADGLLELEWPDQDRTPLHKVASEDHVSAIFKRAYHVLDSLGITNVAK